MFFKQVIIQGLFGVAKGERLLLHDGLCEPLLPSPLDHAKFKDLITLILYPKDTLDSGMVSVDITVPYPVRLGALLDIGGFEYKLMWDMKADSLQVFNEQLSTTEPVVEGRQGTQDLWQKLLGLLPFGSFPLVHYHAFAITDENASKDETGKLVEEFRASLAVERIETRIGSRELELREIRTAKSPAMKVEAALDQVNQQLKTFEKMPALNDADRVFLANSEVQNKAQRKEFNELLELIDNIQRRRSAASPEPVFSNKLVQLSLVLSLACLIGAIYLSVADSPKYRSLALGTVLGLGAVCFAVTRHITLIERHDVLTARSKALEVQRKENEKATERATTRLKRLQKLFGGGSPEQIVEDVDRFETLKEKKTKLQAMLKTHLSDPIFIKSRQTIVDLEEEIARLKTERASFGDYVMPTYGLRAELEKRGVAADNIMPTASSPETPLIDLSRRLKLLPDDRPNVAASEMQAINRLVPGIVGKREASLQLKENHFVVFDGESPERPLKDLPPRQQVLWLRAIALGVLLHHNKANSRRGDHISMLVLSDLWEGMQRADRIRLFSLLKEFSKEFQVILPKVGE